MGKQLYGLVLAGGTSQRMGQDKGLINWHGKAQRYYLADLLSGFCDKSYISCRPDQEVEIKHAGYATIPDSVSAKSQYGAILTAMKNYPSVAWLVVACDMPHIDSSSLSFLISKRDHKQYATAYINPETKLPEPLISIWESSAKKMLETEYSNGITCPRKALKANIDIVNLIKPQNQKYIFNANTPDDAKIARKIIANEKV